MLKGKEQLELHDGQLTGVSILAAKGSHLGDGPGGFAVWIMCREELELPLNPETCDCFVDLDMMDA